VRNEERGIRGMSTTLTDRQMAHIAEAASLVISLEHERWEIRRAAGGGFRVWVMGCSTCGRFEPTYWRSANKNPTTARQEILLGIVNGRKYWKAEG
jgi:hypothetical protein